MYKILRYISLKCIISLCLILLMGCFFLSGCSSEKENAGRYKSISDIKGAETVEDSETVFYVENNDDPLQPEDFLELYLKKTEDSICVGELTNPLVVEYKFADPSRYWKISTFDIKVDDPVRNLEKTEVVKVVAVSLFYNDNMLNRFNTEKMGDRYSKDSKGLFILRKLTDEHRWTIGLDDDEIKLIDYADYYLTAYYKTDGNEFNYIDLGIIQIDDFRDKN